MTILELARYVDHTNLKPDAQRENIAHLCAEAREYNFKAVCVAPLWVKLAHQLLSGSETVVCTVAGFPLGYSTTRIKGRESAEAVATGAAEIDMVIPVGLVKAGCFSEVSDDIAYVVKCIKTENTSALVKVIIETCYLSDEEKERVCLLARDAGADFVKTSTGFGSGGATVNDIRLMRSVVGDAMGVKAAGGIKTYEDALAMIEAGADRIGTSSGVAIIKEKAILRS